MITPLKTELSTKRLLGYWSILPCPQVHEILSSAGYSFAIVDMEHGSYSFQEALTSIIAIQKSGMYALIRPSSHDPKEILRCLELGVDGICVPQVQTFSQAQSVLDACFYPPKGCRGASGFTRASSYGDIPFSEHVKQQNQDLFVMLLIEDMDGISNLNDIVLLEGIGGIYFGTYDLASSLSAGEDQNSSRVVQIVKNAMDIVSNNNLIGGQVSVTGEQFNNLDSRINFVAAGVDCGILLNGAKTYIQTIVK